MCHKIKVYTSDLSTRQWETIRELLPLRKEGAGRPFEIDMRQAVNGMLYIAKTGSHWENLPGSFPIIRASTIITGNGVWMGHGSG